jgi:hypothetical protein
MSPSTITETRPSGHQVGERVELARYTISAGERVIYGQRIDGVVRFLPGSLDVLVAAFRASEDDTCRSRTVLRAGGCAHEDRRRRPSGAGEPRGLVAPQRGDWS